MNIFYLDDNPVVCAQYHLDKHVTKMCVEYAQLMSTAHRIVDGERWEGRTANGRKIARWFHPDPEFNENLYLACHVNHPSAQWVRQSKENYNWLYKMWTSLCKEYTYRYNRIHESQRKLEAFLMESPIQIKDVPFTQPTPAMGQFSQCIVKNDSLTSYRNYYFEAKRGFAKWTGRKIPAWWIEYERKRIQTETTNG
jgi:hypothetical protein